MAAFFMVNLVQGSYWVDIYLPTINLSKYPPNCIMLHMLGIKAGVQVYDWLKSSQKTVDSNEQQLELSTRGAVGESLLQ